MDAHKLIEESEEYRNTVQEIARDCVNTFIDMEGELLTIDQAIEHIPHDDLAARVVAHLATDGADPVQQVTAADGVPHFGVIDYWEGAGVYGFEQYDDTRGISKRVVCSQCVHERKLAENVGKVTGHDVELSTYEELEAFLHDRHYKRHDVEPEAVEIEIGASLASGTTINGNTAIHGGNQGSFEIDSFAGNNGSNGQFLQTDGSVLSFTDQSVSEQVQYGEGFAPGLTG